MYNHACKLLADENWTEAEKALRRAIDACLAFFKEEGESEEDAEHEAGTLRVQLGFALQMQGGADREREAQVRERGGFRQRKK